MYKIKQVPEDFIVKEIMDLNFNKTGKYSYYSLQKKDLTTQKAAEIISRKLKIRRKFINFAGNKDKKAVTEQYFSINMGSGKNLDIENLKLKYLGRGKERINLGTLNGNEFTITIRNIEEKPKKIEKIVNYFDEQRFGINKNNHVAGKFIIKKDFKKAIEEVGYGVKDRNYVSALRQIQKRTLRIYVHAYQSYLWNKTAEEYLKIDNKNTKIPIIGFGTEIEDKRLKKIIDDILKKEKITLRDFIIREMPELSSEGGERDLFAEVQNLKINNLEDDELNKGKKKCVVSFYLQKGAYATIAIKTMLADFF